MMDDKDATEMNMLIIQKAHKKGIAIRAFDKLCHKWNIEDIEN